MKDQEILRLLRQAGFRGDGLRTAWAIARRESGFNPRAHNPNRSTGDDSYGLFQINMLGDMGPSRRRQYGLSSNQDLFDPLTNAKVAFRMSGGGKDFGAWGVGPNAYRKTNLDTSGFPGGSPSVPYAAPAAPDFSQLALTGTLDPGENLKALVDLVQARSVAPTGVIPDTGGMRYPRATGKVPRSAVGMVEEAYRWLGTPYSWAGGGISGPSRGVGRGAKTVGFDCSGFLQYVWGKRGVKIPRVTYQQWRSGRPVDSRQLQPGDAVFFNMTDRGPGHVGMYVGGGRFIHAPKTGDVVKVSSLNEGYYRGKYVGARRYA